MNDFKLLGGFGNWQTDGQTDRQTDRQTPPQTPHPCVYPPAQTRMAIFDTSAPSPFGLGGRLRFRPSHIGGAVVDFGIFYMGKKMFLSFPTRGPIQNFMAIPTRSLNKKALNKNFESLFHLSVIYNRYLLLKFKCCMKTTPIFDPFLHNPSFNNHWTKLQNHIMFLSVI